MADFNFPTAPSTGLSNLSYPLDLIANGRNFCTRIEFQSYQWSTGSIYKEPSGGVTLPIPKKINDLTTVIWEEVSAMQAGAAAMSAIGLGGIAGAAGGLGPGGAIIGAMAGGYALNPFLTMLFKQPNFKEYTFDWTFVANNRQESQAIANIANYIKKSMLPGTAAGGLFYTYPLIAMIKFYPDTGFTFKFKPCAVIGCNVDYTGAGGPAFNKLDYGGAPTVVNLSLNLKEIELWTRDNYRN